MNALVLLSGGIDSSCCVALYRQMGHEVTGVFIDHRFRVDADQLITIVGTVIVMK